MKILMRTVLFFCSVNLLVSCYADEPQTASRLQPAYVAKTNGMFAVCQFDPKRKVLLRWKDVCISSNQLPQAGPNRPVLIFDRGTRPPIDRSQPGMIRTPKGFYHHYGKVPYPIEEIDPPMEYSLDAKGNLLIGFSLQGKFYAIREEKTSSLKTTPAKKYWSKVIHINLPAHRKKELEYVEEQLLKQPPSTKAKMK